MGEALGLRWVDVDLEGRTLRVQQTVQRVKGGLVFAEPKSPTSRRVIPLPDVAVSALTKHRMRQNEQRLAIGNQRREEGLVFTTSVGTPLDPPRVRREFRKLLKAANLAPMRVHDLRHTCASLLIALGVHPRTVMETLGHSQISVTMDTYGHVLPAVARDAADRLNSVLTVRIAAAG